MNGSGLRGRLARLEAPTPTEASADHRVVGRRATP